ncbi:MAG TPA: N,N-dimethylformamidase beta subunit family domain-containing protein [Polyangia bacterium]|nr:N,N-dimethylformamidase beta subunit family domain-containing protein [Polyangia bacterium]
MKSIALSIVAACTACSHSPDESTPPQPNLIADENALAGDPGWEIDSAAPSLAAFARPLSLRAGERLDVPASSDTPAAVSWAVYRLGQYGGAGARKLAEGGPITVGKQPDPFIDAATGLVECRWTPSFSVDVGHDWLSGTYVVKLQRADGGATYAPFIVRDDRRADVIVVMPTATDAAYNDWGGESLYVDTRFNFPAGHAHEVSYDRPNTAGAGGGYMLSTALPTARYLEANGYDVTYVADHDLDGTPSTLDRAKLVLALGHDEYWSRATRDHYDAARAAGISLGFFGANVAYWQVRYDAAWDGLPLRRQIGYKEDADLDPLRHVDDPDVSGAFRGDVLKRPENALLGVMSVDWHMVDFPWVVEDPASWIYAGLGVQKGDVFPAVVGIESDAVVDNGFTPHGVLVVAQSPTVGGAVWGIDQQQATVYDTTAGGFVFAAGSIRFAGTLSGARGQLGPQKILRNLIARAGGQPHGAEDTLDAESGFPAADFARAAAQVTTVAGSPGVAGFADGPGAAAQLSSPLGVALAPDGALIVADGGNHRIRRVAPDAAHTVSTLAGSGFVGDDDGPAASATFRNPWGVAVAADGTVFVTDVQSRRVRQIAADGTVSTIAGDSAALSGPTGIALAADGTLWVTELYSGAVRTIAPGGATQAVALDTGTDGGLGFPTGIFADGGSFVVVDSGNRVLRRLDPGGRLTVIAGSSEGGFADGSGADARLGPMVGVARLGPSLVFADAGNYRVRVVEPGPDLASTRVRTLAGSGRFAAADGAGASAGLVAPTGLAIDVLRNIIYVADTGNHTIRALTP